MKAERDPGLTVGELFSLPSGTLVEDVYGHLALTCDRPGLVMLTAKIEGEGSATLLDDPECFTDGEWRALVPGERVILTQDKRHESTWGGT